jgi:hypothetical protein
VACPVLSHPALRKRLFLDEFDLTLEALEDVLGSVSRIAIYDDDLFRGIVQPNE